MIIVPYECEEEYTLKNLLKNKEVSPKKVLYIIAEVVKIKDIELEKYDLIIVPYECEEEYTLKNLLKNKEVSPKKVLYIIGPEGGFDSEEIEYLKSKGANIVTLGKRILRAETASIVVGGILINEFQ